MDYKQWLKNTPHPDLRVWRAVDIDWDIPDKSDMELGIFDNDNDAENEVYRKIVYRVSDPTWVLESGCVSWQRVIDKCAYNDGYKYTYEEEAREAYDKYLKTALAPDAPGMDKWMAEKQAEHFGTDAGVGDPLEGNG